MQIDRRQPESLWLLHFSAARAYGLAYHPVLAPNKAGEPIRRARGCDGVQSPFSWYALQLLHPAVVDLSWATFCL